jgi:hypothetical protein
MPVILATQKAEKCINTVKKTLRKEIVKQKYKNSPPRDLKF